MRTPKKIITERYAKTLIDEGKAGYAGTATSALQALIVDNGKCYVAIDRYDVQCVCYYYLSDKRYDRLWCAR